MIHPLYAKADKLSHEVIGAAMEVHTIKGAGLIESIYEKCMLRELDLRGIRAQSQVNVPIEYKGITFDEELRVDLLVEDCLIVELKCVETVHPVHKAQLLSYMKLLNVPVGLLINFYTEHLKDGLRRFVLKGASG